MRKIIPPLFVSLFVATTSALADQAAIDQALAAIDAKAATIDTYTADQAMQMHIGGMTMRFDGRVSGKGDMFESIANADFFGQKMGNRTITGADNVMWTEMDMMGEKMVMKANADALANASSDFGAGFGFARMFTGSSSSSHPRNVIKAHSETYDWVDVQTQELEGAQVYVLIGKIKESAKQANQFTEELGEEFAELMGVFGGGENMKLYVSVDDGFIRKMEMVGPDEQPLFTQTYSNVKINIPLDDALFAYTPPDGVEVMDLAEMSEGGFGFNDPGSGFNTKLKVDDFAPEFEGTTLANKPIKLSDYRGKVVLLDFWASWCVPCVNELPNLIASYDELHPQGLEIVGISLDDDRTIVDSFVRSHKGFTWVQVFDGQGWEGAIPQLYGVDSIPYTLLLDKEGKIIAKDVTGERLKDAVTKALGK